jgi:diguanylate cyclase (GGDEF)-like protein/PAS domain S-box-containing protein
MLKRRAATANRISPVALLLALLLLVFSVEMAFTFAFDAPLREREPVWLIALLDAALLTVVVWVGARWLFVRPLQVALSSEAAHAKAVFDATAQAIISTDDHGTIAAFNPAAERVFGYTAREVIGKNIGLLIHGGRPHKPERFISWYPTAGREAQRGVSREWIGVRKDGSALPIEVDLTAVRLVKGARYTCFIHDIAERKRIEESTRKLAYHDTLTGLPNRMLLYDRMRQSIALGKRHKQRFAVLYLDLDGFKAVNDRLGHDAGDQLLKSAAQRVHGLLRESDTVARMGGDEFIVILVRSGGRAAVARVARKIIKGVAAPFRLSNPESEVTISGSIGIAIYPDDGEEIDALVKAADTAMYRAKRMGGAYCFFGHEETGRPARPVG